MRTLLLVLAVGCTTIPPVVEEAESISPANSGAEIPAAPVTETPVDLCVGKTGAEGDADTTITSNGIERQFMIHVPPGATGKQLPIVLVLHPLLLTYTDMRKLANVESYSDDSAHGFIALFPNGIERSWNAGECCGKAKDNAVEDVTFIKDLLAHVEQKWCVDKKRTYSMGFSNGAFLSYRLACELPNGLRAIGPVAGTLGVPRETCKPVQKPAILHIHGTEDDLCPYDGGPPHIPFGSRFGTFLSPGETDKFWASANGCSAEAKASSNNGEVSCVRHDGCNSTVELCTVNGGGHQWPGGSSLPAMGPMTKDIDATKAIMEHFVRNGL